MKELIELIAKSLVDDPDSVRVAEIDEGPTTVFELEVAPSDLGVMIGKQGRTVRALRTLLDTAGVKLDREYDLEILE